MSESVRQCFTCSKYDDNNLQNVNKIDKDRISYLEKLRFCFEGKLRENDKMDMCWSCIRNLRISYNFRKVVLKSQGVLGENVVPILDLQRDSDEVQNTESNETSENSVEIHEKCVEIFKCEYCETEFSRKSQLTRHKIRKHDVRNRYTCCYCSKEFKQSFHLREHLSSHTGEKNYSCPVCDKQFLRLSSQKRHQKSHERPPGGKTKRTPFLCTICGKSFPFSNGVQRHMRTHLGIRKFECHVCRRKFSQSTHLNVHMRTHTGEKPYICDTCGEQFSIRACLQKHINKRHFKKETAAEEAENLPLLYLSKDFQDSGLLMEGYKVDSFEK